MTDRVELQKSERMLGEYQAQIARPTSSGWVGSIPMLNASITNQRLILVQQTRRPHPPASIPFTYITKVSNITLSHRSAVQIKLRMGYVLHLFVGWGQSEDFAGQLHSILVPALRSRRYQPVLGTDDVHRLIEQISHL
jgi:hypothetical protein